MKIYQFFASPSGREFNPRLRQYFFWFFLPHPPIYLRKCLFYIFANQTTFINTKVGAKCCKYVPPSNIKELIPGPPTPLTSVVLLNQASLLWIIGWLSNMKWKLIKRRIRKKLWNLRNWLRNICNLFLIFENPLELEMDFGNFENHYVIYVICLVWSKYPFLSK